MKTTKMQERIIRYKRLLVEQVDIPNTELAHLKADNIISDLLRELGYGEVVDIYDEVDKWYT